jgi:hypothetical protein
MQEILQNFLHFGAHAGTCEAYSRNAWSFAPVYDCGIHARFFAKFLAWWRRADLKGAKA